MERLAYEVHEGDVYFILNGYLVHEALIDFCLTFYEGEQNVYS